MKPTNMWHDQGELVGCWEYWFWVTSFHKWQILMFYNGHCLKTSKHCSSLCKLDVWLRWDLYQNVAFYMNKLVISTEISKLNIANIKGGDVMWCDASVGSVKQFY